MQPRHKVALRKTITGVIVLTVTAAIPAAALAYANAITPRPAARITASGAQTSIGADMLTDWRTTRAVQVRAQLHAQAAAAARQARARARAAAARARQEALAAAQERAQAQADPAQADYTVNPQGAPQAIAQADLAAIGEASQFSCLQALWNAESGWNVYAFNPNSGAYGIPQALPGSKMASAGPDWQTSAATQIRWGIGYIQASYGGPCAAWSHWQAAGWY